MKIKIIFVIIVLATVIITAPIASRITAKSKDREFARTERVYEKTVDRYATAYDSLARKATYLISQTLTIKKNKKGQTIFVPSSTMEIDKIIKSIDKNIKNPVDSFETDTIKPETFWEKIRNIFK